MKTPRQFWRNMFTEEKYIGRDLLICILGMPFLVIVLTILGVVIYAIILKV